MISPGTHRQFVPFVKTCSCSKWDHDLLGESYFNALIIRSDKCGVLAASKSINPNDIFSSSTRENSSILPSFNSGNVNWLAYTKLHKCNNTCKFFNSREKHFPSSIMKIAISFSKRWIDWIMRCFSTCQNSSPHQLVEFIFYPFKSNDMIFWMIFLAGILSDHRWFQWRWRISWRCCGHASGSRPPRSGHHLWLVSN